MTSTPEHQHRVYLHAATKDEGKGIIIHYGVADSPFGKCFIALTPTGICSLQFTEDKENLALSVLRQKWSQAIFRYDKHAASRSLQSIFSFSQNTNFQLCVQATPFQLNVWKSLTEVGFGELISYESLACLSGHPRAVRATASAVARNPIAYLIPCHRVIHKNGDTGAYRWGKELKKQLLDWEANY
jgi:AraC family transcriptional regulator of adaptative response/methylated-DNA-[protein]-cysteine methyltransferase